MSRFMDRLNQQVLLMDGGMGTALMEYDLDLESDFKGLENCSEILCETRPDVVRQIHENFFAAGSDAVETNTFGSNKVVLEEFGLTERTRELNKMAVDLAREVADKYETEDWPRFVIGCMGPGTKLPSLNHTDYDTLEDSYAEQARGLIDGGVDAFLTETSQDPLQIKAAINGIRIAQREAGVAIPIISQVTIETVGTMLVGTEIQAAATILDAMDVDLMGMNCATGPAEMSEHVKWLGENWPRPFSVLPNAGLPMLVDGKTTYPLQPEEMADWMVRFVEEDGVNLIGGCCGTDASHIKALRDKIGHRAPKDRGDVKLEPALASLYNQVPYRQENAVMAIGERTNANGSKKFRELLNAEDWNGITRVAKDQVKEGAHTLDVCTAYVGRDEVRDMTEVISRLRGDVTIPLVIDSTETPVIDAALKLYGGKALINSINFEEGEEKAGEILGYCKKYGAGVIALTIDEDGMAKEVEDKMRIARRLYDFAVNQHGLPAHDLMFDPLTFTVCTGNEEDRKHAINTLGAIEAIASEMPDVQIVLGLSNISFGLKPAARQVLNSVMLHHAQSRGLTAAIMHSSAILPKHKIADEEYKVAEDLLFDRREEGYDPLHKFIELFKDKEAAGGPEKKKAETIEEVLQEPIIDGDRDGIEADLDKAMETYAPIDIINKHLLGGMKVVGDLFGKGEMQLPFVLQAAETMKAAVAHLENYMEKEEGETKGTLVLATVKGDVHDIGKNLVDIILTNNGYNVVNIGIKQPCESIIEATQENKADVVGMSGLLVKSTVIMKENLEEMRERGIETPVLLGGAALTRDFVESDCNEAYGEGVVEYAKDAFAGLQLMDQLTGNAQE
jgi:5-methyltetrahydrofolate--homocysteine methyltransferase